MAAIAAVLLLAGCSANAPMPTVAQVDLDPLALLRTIAMILGIPLALGMLLLGGTLLPDPELPLTVIANVGLLAIGSYSIARSLRALRRLGYWGGILLIAIAAVSRFVEFETSLLAKAFFFTAGGVIVIYAGLSFERRAAAAEEDHAA